MKKIQIIAIASLLMTGCSRPDEKIIPSNRAEWDKLSATVAKLPPEDQRLFNKYMRPYQARPQAQLPLGLRIKDAIKIVRDAEDREKEQAREQQENLKKSNERKAFLSTAILGRVLSIDQSVENDRLRLKYAIDLWNTTPHTVTMVDFKIKIETKDPNHPDRLVLKLSERIKEDLVNIKSGDTHTIIVDRFSPYTWARKKVVVPEMKTELDIRDIGFEVTDGALGQNQPRQ